MDEVRQKEKRREKSWASIKQAKNFVITNP